MLPEAFLKRMERLLGAEFEEFMASYDRPRAVGLRRNPRRAAGELPFALTPVPWEKNGYYYDPSQRPGLHPWHEAGAYYLQEPSAMAPAMLLDAQPGEIVLDLCAAPGGKSTQIAAAMQGSGLLVCNEIVPSRAKILSQNIERMGIPNALVLSEHPAKLAERFPHMFDRIMVDAPCSGEGMFRKEEAAVRDWSEEQVLVCAHRQREILESAAKMLRAGGRIVYSTCTFAPEENEGVVSAFLRDHPDFSVAEVDAPWFTAGRPDWIEDAADGIERTFRLFPHQLRGEGHFAAVLQYNGADDMQQSVRATETAAPKELTDLLRALGTTLPQGRLMAFGAMWYLVPPKMPDLRGLKVLRAGLCLGEAKKGRFEPHHALALWLDSAASEVDFAAQSSEIAAFMRGEPLAGEASGWTLVKAGGCSLGWAKGSGGMLKNHYPKGLRRVT